MAIIMGILAAALASAPAAAASSVAQVLPTVYEAGHFFAVPETREGQRLRLMVDTGGGGGAARLYWVTAQAAKRLRLKTHTCMLDAQTPITVAELPDYKPGHGLPVPASSPCGKVLMVQDVRPEPVDDGQFSGSYLYAGGTWTFDYPARRLTLQGGAWRPDPAAHAIRLGFQHDRQGHATQGYPRIVVQVDGQPLDMLLDTGATAHPTPEGVKASGAPTVHGFGVTSYITTSVFNRWHQAHPGWRVVTNGDDLFGSRHPMRLIEVPKLEIAGWSVGPVWFTERPDPPFHEMMSSMMDRQIEGSVGANVFGHFVMTLDYPRETAWFHCMTGCEPAATPPPAP